MKKRIWTNAARTHLFEEVVRQFGPHSEWQKERSPGRGLDDKFDKFCKAMAVVTGASGPDAVEQQIAFGSPVTGNAKWSGYGHSQTAILCLAAAFDAGFIKAADLPDLKATQRKPQARKSKRRMSKRRDQTTGIEAL